MTVFGTLVMIAGAVACFMTYTNRGSSLMTPDIYLAGVTAIVGAILCAVGEITHFRVMIEERLNGQPKEEAVQETAPAKEE